MRYFFLLFCAAVFSACNTAKTATYAEDPHSFARPNEAVVKHLSLDITVDFESKTIAGTATLSIENFGAKQLYLDSKDLNITQVWLADGTKKEATKFSFGKKDSILGSPLIVDIQDNTKKVVVEYTTSPHAEALQWLTPKQTAGKQYPYLLTQSEAILARTWVPIQDGPGVRITYDATVHVPKELMAVMSAAGNPQEKSVDGVYHFEQKQAIPAYLLALAVGDIAFKSCSNRVGVYAEPVELEKCAKELDETEKMVELAEGLYGKYAWGRYDIIVLPPSFPFGGMENPCLTFATPTIIVGDKSLVTLVAHELAHSWSGNLVTNATWDDFWLNEGFTVYFEQRIMEALKGREYSEMLAQICYQDWMDEKGDLKEADTRLKIDLKGRNPDDGMTSIAYDKGYFFLRLIEETVGREKWDGFLKNYFQENAFHSMTTEKFVNKLNAFLTPEQAKKIDLQAWIYTPGVPSNCPKVNSSKFLAVEDQVLKLGIKKNWMDLQAQDWTTHEWVHFLTYLPKNISISEIQDIDKTFHLTESKNSEIQFLWYKLAVEHSYTAAYPAMTEFLTKVGRRKFLTPLYKAMLKTSEGTILAKAIYEKARPNYHSISVGTIDDLMKNGGKNH